MPEATNEAATQSDAPALTTVADKLRYLRSLPGNTYTQEQLADHLTEVTGRKRHRGYISGILNGTIPNPHLEELEALATKLGANPDYFRDDEVSARVVNQVDLIRALRDDGVRELITSLRDGGLREVAARLLTKVADDDIPAVVRMLRETIEQGEDRQEPEAG